jgi:prepilin-type N-terminal cleavage/methylation domain-containing protein
MKGLTLFEVLVSIVVFSIIAMGLGSAVVAGKSALLVSDIPTQLRGNLLFALMPMVRELRQTAPGRLVGLGEGASSSSIRFSIPHDNTVPPDGIVVNAIGNIEWGSDIIYARNGLGQLTRTFGGATSVIAPNIATLQFSRPVGDDALIQIDITAGKIDGQGTLHQDAEQAIVKMRN